MVMKERGISQEAIVQSKSVPALGCDTAKERVVGQRKD